MRRAWLLVVIAALVMPALAGAAGEKDSAEQKKLNTQAKKLSYAVGMQIAKSLEDAKIDLDIDLLMRGVKDALDDGETLLSAREAEKVRQEYARQRKAEAEKKRQATARKRKKEAEKFLAKNKEKEGVKTTDSGLQYKVLTEGDGGSPTEADRVDADLKIKTIGGKEIFNSKDAEQDQPLPVAGLLPGLTEGLKMMQEGAEYRLFMPPKLGIKRQGKAAGPGLIVDVKLNKVLEGAATKEKEAPAKGMQSN